MAISFHHIAYEALEVCNALPMSSIDDALDQAVLLEGARALDIGTGNAAVAVRLAQRYGLDVRAVEYDAGMADLAAARISASSASARVSLSRAMSGDVLAASDPFELIVAIGTTEPAGGGLRQPEAVFAALADHLVPGGYLLWGDLVWTSPPPAPLRQIVEMTNIYADHDGWQAAAHAAGFQVVSARLSDDAAWDAYTGTMTRATEVWLRDNPDHADAQAVEMRADQVRMMFEFGRPFIGFGLYLLRRRDEAASGR